MPTYFEVWCSTKRLLDSKDALRDFEAAFSDEPWVILAVEEAPLTKGQRSAIPSDHHWVVGLITTERPEGA